MLRKNKDNSDYEIDRELTWKFAIEKNAEYQEKIEELEEENKKLREEIKKLKEERIFSLGEYDYMILTSTTPQLKIIKKNQNYSLMEEDTLQELRDIGEI